MDTAEGPLFFEGEKSRLDPGASDQGDNGVPPLPLPADLQRKKTEIYCSICKDTIETGYNSDRDEWVVKGAIYLEDKYYHSRCWHEGKKRVCLKFYALK